MVRGRVATGIAFSVGLAAALSIFGIAAVLPDGAPVGGAAGSPGEGLATDAAPLAAGTEVPLSQAVASVPFSVPRPDTDLASDASIAEVWVRTSWDPEVLIQYSSGVRVEVRRNSLTLAPEEFYKGLVAEGIPGQIVPIDGVNVFIAPQRGEGNLGSATMVVNGLFVSIVGDGDFTVDQLQSLANSVLDSAGATSGSMSPST